jgi:16S rRNA (cytosine1407-C5)-methyltransferase
MTEPTSGRLQSSLERFAGILTEQDIQQILAIQNQPLPTGIRLNPLKADPKQEINRLASRYGWQTAPVPFCQNAWTIENADTSPGGTIEHRMGLYYLQDAASMVPVSLFDFNTPNPLILDMASSPGGKTTHLIDRTCDTGFILANDASKSRIPALRAVLNTWGGINQAVTQFPGESFGSWFPETFDAVLLDAPCSMENLRPTESHPLRETSYDERLRLQERQIQILISGLRALKTGGQMVYATCSLAPEEDEAVINAALNTFPHSLEIQDVSDKFSFITPGLTQFKGEIYNPQLQHALRMWPHLTGMSGFFCVRLSKIAPLPAQPASPPVREFSKTGLQTPTKPNKKQVFEQILNNYGFDMDSILAEHRLELMTRYDQLFLIPQSYLQHFITLPYEFIGMAIGRWAHDQFEPSHEFISRFGRMFTQGKISIGEDQLDAWIAGRDIRYPQTALSPSGQYLMVTDEYGRNLGMGKLLPKRLRNMLPRQSF